MFVAKVIDGQIVDSGDLAKMYPNTSFPASGPSDDWMQEQSLVAVKTWKTHDTATQKLESADLYLEDGEVYGVQIVSLSQAELDGIVASAASRVRSERNRRLTESDWTQLADSPLTAEEKAEWATYRQTLRDISSSEGFPSNVTFPLRPGEVPMEGMAP